MGNELPVHSAVQKVIELFGYGGKILIDSPGTDFNELNGNKIWCVIDDESTLSFFFEKISSVTCPKLSPVLIISAQNGTESPLGIFDNLSAKFPALHEKIRCI